MSSVVEYYRDRYGQPFGWDPTREPTFERRVSLALEAIGSVPQRVLDFGCNTGGASGLLAKAGHRVTGVDISESAIREARRRVPGPVFQRIDSESRLPFDNGSFDVCYSSEVLEHLFDIQGFIAEAYRVLVPEGTLLITTPYHGWIKNLLVVTLNFERHFDPTGGHVRFFSRRSLDACLRTGGFRVRRFRGVGRCWPVWRSMFIEAKRNA